MAAHLGLRDADDLVGRGPSVSDLDGEPVLESRAFLNNLGGGQVKHVAAGEKKQRMGGKNQLADPNEPQ